jgi:hypothetical protein
MEGMGSPGACRRPMVSRHMSIIHWNIADVPAKGYTVNANYQAYKSRHNIWVAMVFNGINTAGGWIFWTNVGWS